jgi:hypothetical protein
VAASLTSVPERYCLEKGYEKLVGKEKAATIEIPSGGIFKIS